MANPIVVRIAAKVIVSVVTNPDVQRSINVSALLEQARAKGRGKV